MANKIEELRIKLGFDNSFTVDREGRGGGWQLFGRSLVGAL